MNYWYFPYIVLLSVIHELNLWQYRNVRYLGYKFYQTGSAIKRRMPPDSPPSASNCGCDKRDKEQ